MLGLGLGLGFFKSSSKIIWYQVITEDGDALVTEDGDRFIFGVRRG